MFSIIITSLITYLVSSAKITNDVHGNINVNNHNAIQSLSGDNNLFCSPAVDSFNILSGTWSFDCEALSTFYGYLSAIWLGSADGTTVDSNYDFVSFKITTEMWFESGETSNPSGDFGNAGIKFRQKDISNFYSFYIYTDFGNTHYLSFGKSLNGVWTRTHNSNNQYTIELNTLYTIIIEVSNNLCNIWVNDVLEFENIDVSDIESGSAGVYSLWTPDVRFWYFDFIQESTLLQSATTESVSSTGRYVAVYPDTAVTFDVAREYCQYYYYDLAEIISLSENTEIAKAVEATGVGDYFNAIIGYRRVSDNSLIWVNDMDDTFNYDSIYYTNWYEGEPNDLGEEDCVVLVNIWGYQWNDYNCANTPETFVCEVNSPNLFCSSMDDFNILAGGWSTNQADCEVINTEQDDIYWLGSEDGTPNNDYDYGNTFIIESKLRFETDDGQEGSVGVKFRYKDANNFYSVYIYSRFTAVTYMSFGKLVDNSWTQLSRSDAFTISLDTTYTIRIEVLNNIMTAYLNGELIFQNIELSDISTGSIGIYSYNTPDVRFTYLNLAYNNPSLLESEVTEGTSGNFVGVVPNDGGVNAQIARDYCQYYYYDLATVTDNDENDEAITAIRNTGVEPNEFNAWIGYTDSDIFDSNNIEGTFGWMDGDSTSYTNWYDGEPNDAGNNEDCTVIVTAWGNQWNDAPCTATPEAFVCTATAPTSTARKEMKVVLANDNENNIQDYTIYVIAGAVFIFAVFGLCMLLKCGNSDYKYSKIDSTGAGVTNQNYQSIHVNM